MEKLDLSIIIISFNTERLTRECINSVFQKTKGIAFEIIVIDNNSSDGSVAMLEGLARKHPQVKVIKNKENLGFGQANNQGMKISRGRYILLLNSDTKVLDNALGEMVSWMDKNPKAGIASSGLRFKDGKIQGTGGYFPTLPRVLTWMSFFDDIPFMGGLIKPFHPMHGLSPLDKNIDFFKEKKQMDWLTGAFFLIRRSAFKEVGYFDKDYFMYVEEVDYCYRTKLKGWEIWYLPKWRIIHYGGASSTSEFPLINEIKGLKTFYKKHMPGWQFGILRALLKTGTLLRIFVFGILRGKEAARTYAKVFLTA
ncbi:glycosyltransferase family 2 protein [Candidatus Woesebacteria bacterium]|nr:glycosyltransferase family 2 protein [Candidatus Woesebacteria bacterium]